MVERTGTIRTRHRPEVEGEREPETYDRERDRERRERHEKATEKAIRDYWRRNKDHRPHYTPWLVIRYGSGDFGLRPLPSGVPFWNSPDIWVESTDPNGNAVAGESNFVWVRLFNLGMATAAPVRVDYYWANPALGLTPATMNLIGTEWVEVKSQFSREVRCSKPWIPVLLNNGHECLEVNCTNPPFDPITAPFQPNLDRHVGQRNITVLQAPAGAILPLQLELTNILPIGAKTHVLARSIHVAVSRYLRETISPVGLTNRLATLGNWVPTPLEMQARLVPGTRAHRNAVLAAPWAKPPERDIQGSEPAIRPLHTAPRVNASVSETRGRLLAADSRRALARRLMSREVLGVDHPAPRADLQGLLQIALEPLEVRNLDVELQVPYGARNGEYVVFQFEQWGEDIQLGGYTAVVAVVEPRRKKSSYPEQVPP